MINDTLLNTNLAGKLTINDDIYFTYGGIITESFYEKAKCTFIAKDTGKVKIIIVNRYVEFETLEPVIDTDNKISIPTNSTKHSVTNKSTPTDIMNLPKETQLKVLKELVEAGFNLLPLKFKTYDNAYYISRLIIDNFLVAYSVKESNDSRRLLKSYYLEKAN